MSATVRDRGVARMASLAFGAAMLAGLAVPVSSAQAQLTLVDFGVTSLSPSLTSVRMRMASPYARTVLTWPGAARLPVVMP